jgi:WS/DGAT/MGAT family acyltransferase
MTPAEKPGAPLSLVDAACLRIEDRTSLVVNAGALLFDEPLDFARVKEALEQRLLGFPRFRQRLVFPKLPLALPHWEDALFDLRAHLHRLALPGLGDDRALREVLSDLISAPLDLALPPWQAHLIEGHGNGCVLLWRLHHCLADGMAIVRVLRSITGGRPPAPPTASDGRAPAALAPSLLAEAEALLHRGAELLLHPGQSPVLAGASEAATTLARLLLMPPDAPTPFKGPVGVVKQVAWSAALPEGEIKALGRALRASAHEVLLAAVTGALRRYLQQRGQPVPDGSLRVAIPVNLGHGAARELGNRFSMTFLALPIGHGDPAERLALIKERLRALQGSREAEVMFGAMQAYGLAPAEVGNLLVRLLGSKVTAVFSTVPGPPKALSFAGTPVRRLLFWAPQTAHLGLSLSAMTYAGSLTLGVAADAGLVPDPEGIVAGLEEEIEELKALALRPPAQPPVNSAEN